jgi:hypothetical protein
MSTLQVNTIETNTPAGVLAVRDVNNALTAIQPGAVRGTAAATPPVFQDSAGTPVGTLCRAWVNFNGTGTVAIRAAFNVSSVTDLGTGSYRINFTTPVPDTNYACVASPTTDAVTFNGYAIASQAGTSKTVNLIGVTVLAPTNAAGTPFAAGHPYDPVELSAAVFR